MVVIQLDARDVLRPIRRVLVTGSRDWSDRVVVERTLWVVAAAVAAFPGPFSATLIHGGGRGVDGIADAWARARVGWQVEVHRANWTLGRRAGPVRNLDMVRAGADLCLAFIKDGSRGASGCATAAAVAGIPTWRSDTGWVPLEVKA